MNFERQIESISEILVANGNCVRSEFIGCSDKEVTEISELVRRKLPEAYLWFLKKMGRGAGAYYRGTDFFYPRVLKVNANARLLVKSDERSLELSIHDFAYSMHQGYQFLFFSLVAGDDPQVHQYIENSGQFERVASSFTSFLTHTALQPWNRIRSSG